MRSRSFFLIFSSLIFPSIQATYFGDDEDDYEENALKLIKATTGAGGTFDWRDCFSRIAPIVILNKKRLQDNVQHLQDNEQRPQEKDELARQYSLDAGCMELILISRERFMFLEKFCHSFPPNHQDKSEFLKALGEIDEKFKTIPENEIGFKKHAKAWLWLLAKSGASDPEILIFLREKLNHEPRRYVWFSRYVQSFFDLLNDEVRNYFRRPRHFNIEKLELFLPCFQTEVQELARIFYECDRLSKQPRANNKYCIFTRPDEKTPIGIS